MEPFKEFFRLDHILRNSIGGVAFYLIIYRENQQDSDFDFREYLLSTSLSWASLAVISIVVGLTGILLHAMERNSISIIAENFREWVIREKILLGWIFPEGAKTDSIWRFHQLKLDERMSRLTDWGASAHCLYTVSMAIFAATLCLLLEHPSDYSYWGFVSYLPLEFIFLFFGLLSDIRKTLMERALAEKPNPMPCS